MPTSGGMVLVVDDGTDSLARRVAEILGRRGCTVEHVPSERLGLLRLHLEAGRVTIEGQRLDSVLFRASPWSRFDTGYADDDSAFATAEIAAAWLAISSLPTVVALNRLHPEASVTFSEWPVWRRSLASAGVAQVDLRTGDIDGARLTWLPWGGGVARAPGTAARRVLAPAMATVVGLRHGLWLDGARLAGAWSSPAERAASCLATLGVRLAGITTDSSGRVVTATSRPRVEDGDLPVVAERVAQVLAS